MCVGNIVGYVRDTFGDPIPGTNVRLYEDFNEDGIADNAVAVRSIFVNSMGSWSMASIPVGSYVITCINPSNFTIVSGVDPTDDSDIVPNIPTTDLVIPVTINPLELDSFNTFTFTTLPGKVTGYVFADHNDNQFPDTGEGVEGVTIELWEDEDQDGVSDGILIDSTTTDATGYYEFNDIATNTYAGRKRHCVIVATVPENYELISGIDVSNDADIVTNTPTTDNVIPVTVTPNEIDAGNYFMVKYPGTISGYVFIDVNANEVLDAGDDFPDFSYVALFADIDGDGVIDGLSIALAYPDANGYYEFTNLHTNTNYLLNIFVQPLDYQLVKAWDASPDGDVVANVPDTDNLIPVTLDLGETDTDNNFIIEIIP